MSAATVLIQSTKPAPSFVTVTPELADRWLKANGGNHAEADRVVGEAPASGLFRRRELSARIGESLPCHCSHRGALPDRPEGRPIRKNKVRVAPRDYLYLIFKAWNYFADGKTVTVLTASPRSDVKLPTIHPDVR